MTTRWQDLKTELTCLDRIREESGVRVFPSPAEVVARRVLTLYDEHAPCHGEGCGLCGYTGVQPARPEAHSAEGVAGYLFGEGDSSDKP